MERITQSFTRLAGAFAMVFTVAMLVTANPVIVYAEDDGWYQPIPVNDGWYAPVESNDGWYTNPVSTVNDGWYASQTTDDGWYNSNPVSNDGWYNTQTNTDGWYDNANLAYNDGWYNSQTTNDTWYNGYTNNDDGWYNSPTATSDEWYNANSLHDGWYDVNNDGWYTPGVDDKWLDNDATLHTAEDGGVLLTQENGGTLFTNEGSGTLYTREYDVHQLGIVTAAEEYWYESACGGCNYSYNSSYGHSVASPSYRATPITVSTGMLVARPTTVAQPVHYTTPQTTVHTTPIAQAHPVGSVSNVSHVSHIDNSIRDSFNTYATNSFNSGTNIHSPGAIAAGTSVSVLPVVTPAYHAGYTYASPITYSAPIVTTPARTGAYVALSQIPYTGLDLGPVGNTIYWLSLVSFAVASAYLLVYYKGGMLAFAGSMVSGRTKSPIKVTLPTAKSEAKTAVNPVIARATNTKDTLGIMPAFAGQGPKLVILRQ